MDKKHERKDEKTTENKPAVKKLSLKVLSNVRGGVVRSGLLAACCTKTHHCGSLSLLSLAKVLPPF